MTNRTNALTAEAKPTALALIGIGMDTRPAATLGALFAVWMRDNTSKINTDNVDEALDAFRAYCLNAEVCF